MAYCMVLCLGKDHRCFQRMDYVRHETIVQDVHSERKNAQNIARETHWRCDYRRRLLPWSHAFLFYYFPVAVLNIARETHP